MFIQRQMHTTDHYPHITDQKTEAKSLYIVSKALEKVAARDEKRIKGILTPRTRLSLSQDASFNPGRKITNPLGSSTTSPIDFLGLKIIFGYMQPQSLCISHAFASRLFQLCKASSSLHQAGTSLSAVKSLP